MVVGGGDGGDDGDTEDDDDGGVPDRRCGGGGATANAYRDTLARVAVVVRAAGAVLVPRQTVAGAGGRVPLLPVAVQGALVPVRPVGALAAAVVRVVLLTLVAVPRLHPALALAPDVLLDRHQLAVREAILFVRPVLQYGDLRWSGRRISTQCSSEGRARARAWDALVQRRSCRRASLTL